MKIISINFHQSSSKKICSIVTHIGDIFCAYTPMENLIKFPRVHFSFDLKIFWFNFHGKNNLLSYWNLYGHIQILNWINGSYYRTEWKLEVWNICSIFHTMQTEILKKSELELLLLLLWETYSIQFNWSLNSLWKISFEIQECDINGEKLVWIATRLSICNLSAE